ncbi:hypothetical protein [Streptomyces sp. NPDC002913]
MRAALMDEAGRVRVEDVADPALKEPPTRSFAVEGRTDPGRVLDRSVPLDEGAEGYRAMDTREALKVLVRP